MRTTLSIAAVIVMVSLVAVPAPASANHQCSDIEDPYIYEGDDDDGDGLPDSLYVCMGEEGIAHAAVNYGSYVSDWSGDRYTYASVWAETAWDGPVGWNYANAYVNCQDEDDDMSGCDGYSVRLYGTTYGTTGDEIDLVLYESSGDGDDVPGVCIGTSLTDERTCEEL